MWEIEYTKEYENWFSSQDEDIIEKNPNIMEGKDA